MSDDPLVFAAGISVDYQTRQGLLRTGNVHALDQVDLSIHRNETIGLVGESGSGKTTLGKATLKLAPITAGQLIFDGVDITQTDSSDLGWFRERAQMIFQDPFSSLNPFMSVETLVAEPLVIDGVKDASERHCRVVEALASVDLTPASRFTGKFANQLSGGQRQRVGIARALIRNPDYVVADEPVSMIDASSRVGILGVLDRLQKERQMAFLFITHDIATARFFADRLAVMYQGHVVEEGTAGAVIDNPLHPYTQALIAAIPEPDPANRFRRRAVVPGEPSSGQAAVPGCPFASRCPQVMPGLCDVVRPALETIEGTHRVACWLYQEPPAAGSA